MTFPSLSEDNDAFSFNLFNNIRRIWLDSEINRRIEDGRLQKTDVIRAAHIIICHKKKTEIRLNEEVSLKAELYKKEGVSYEKGDPVFEHQITGIKSFHTTDGDYANCAHVILLKIGEHYFIHFDFRYDKQHAQDSIDQAKEFYKSAEWSYNNNQVGPFIDNLYSAAELSIKSIFLTWPHITPRTKTTHKRIKNMYEEFGQLGNVEEECLDTFTELSSLRPRVRYYDPKYKISKADCERLLHTVTRMIEDAENRIKPVIDNSE